MTGNVKINGAYDAVVIGEGLSLLCAGLTLGRNGARTLLIPIQQGDSANGSDYFGPFVEGIDLPVLFRELGCAPAELRALAPIQPAYQFISDKKRVDLTTQDDQLHQEYCREYGKAMQSAASHWVELSLHSRDKALKTAHHLSAFTALPPAGWREKFRNRQVSARLWNLHKTRTFKDDNKFWPLMARGLGMMLTNSVPSTPLHQGSAEHLISLARWGTYDGRSISSLLRQQLNKRGVDWLNRGQLQSLVSRRRHIDRIQIKDGDYESLHFGTLILATHPYRLLPYLDGGSKWQPLLKWITQQQIAFDRYLLPIRMLKEGLPIGMQPRTLLIQNPEAPLTHANLLQIDREYTQDQQAVLWVRFVVKHGEAVDTTLIQKIHQHLAEVIPFMQENLLQTGTGPILHGHLYGTAAEHKHCTLFGAGPLTPYKNLLLASSLNLPELGIEGEILSAMKTAHYALVSRVKKGMSELVLERNSISS